jgi:hypothetical protein
MESTTEQDEIFDRLSALLRVYEPPYTAREGTNVSGKDRVELWATGTYEAFGRQRTELYFAGIIKQKGYVGFYLMPVYSDPQEMKGACSPRLLKTLKGKSCFYIRSLDDELLRDIAKALKAGFGLYKTRGWV